MNFKYIRNCLTCEFGIPNTTWDEDFNTIFPDNLIIKCAGNDDLYGKEVSYKSLCKHWSVGFQEFVRVEEGIGYYDYYDEYFKLLDK